MSGIGVASPVYVSGGVSVLEATPGGDSRPGSDTGGVGVGFAPNAALPPALLAEYIGVIGTGGDGICSGVSMVEKVPVCGCGVDGKGVAEGFGEAVPGIVPAAPKAGELWA